MDQTKTKNIRLPNFLVVGSAKCGTTALYEYLNANPDLFLPTQKELKYFCSNSLSAASGGIGTSLAFSNIVNEKNQYVEFYKSATSIEAVGEMTPHYLYYHDEAIPRIRDELGDPVIIILLRNPVDRAYSQYKHLCRDNREFRSFEIVLKKEYENIKRGYEFAWHFKRVGLYYQQVKAFKESFSSVYVYIYEDWKNSFGGLANEIFNALGLKPIAFKTEVRRNVGGVPRNMQLQLFFKGSVWRSLCRLREKIFPWLPALPIGPWLRNINLSNPPLNFSTRAMLNEYFRSDVKNLSDLLDRDLSSIWLGGNDVA